MIKKVAITIVIIALLGTAYIVTKDKPHSFYLIKEEGTVMYKYDESGIYATLNQDEISLPKGSNVMIFEESSAYIILPDNSLISLDENTEVNVEIEQGNIKIQQYSGKTWNRVESLKNGNKFEVEAIDTRITAEGTIFGIEVFPESITTNIEDGKVVFQATNNQITLEEDQSATSSLGTATKKEMDNTLKVSRWYVRNKVLDVMKRTSLDNIFFKDKLKKELQREDFTETRFHPKSSELEDSIFEIVTGSNDPEVCSKINDIPHYATYSKFSEIYQQILSSCTNEKLSSEEIDNLARMYAEIK
jgi:hypothetical protein